MQRKSDIEFIMAKLAEIEKAREKAVGYGRVFVTDEHGVCYGSEPILSNQYRFADGEDVDTDEFIALSANEITKLTKALDVAVNASDRTKNLVMTFYAHDVHGKTLGKTEHNISESAILQIREILK